VGRGGWGGGGGGGGGQAGERGAEGAGGGEEGAGPSASPYSVAGEVALSCMHVDRNELAPARRWQKRADEALRARPDRLLGVAASLVAARQGLGVGRGRASLEIVSRARAGWSPPAWLEREMLLLDS